jgi:hypothetical protein
MMAAISTMTLVIPSLIPININFEIDKSHGIETINYPTFVILRFSP